MPYDHHEKAGNQGDVVKHVALVAALDALTPPPERPCFLYADAFAGYAHNPLGDDASPVDGWKAGIGVLMDRRDRLRKNPHTSLWAELALGDDSPRRGYPGSSVIAAGVLARKYAEVGLSLWDTSSAVVKDLRASFPPQSANVFERAAKWSDEELRSADFLLIDPPGLKSQRRSEYPRWSELADFLKNRPAHQSVLLWLPVKADTTSKPPGEDAASWAALEEAKRYGCQGVRVRWAKGGRTIGCQLIHHLPDAAAKALTHAVMRVVHVAGWPASLPTGVKAVSRKRPVPGTPKLPVPSTEAPESR